MTPFNPDVDARYRTILTLWFAICMSVVLFRVFIYFAPVGAAPNQQLTVALEGLAVFPFALSFLLKRKLLAKSVELQKIDFVKHAYVLSFALSESAALLGVLDHFLTGSNYYYVGFALSGLGMLLHFPKKKHLIEASYKKF